MKRKQLSALPALPLPNPQGKFSPSSSDLDTAILDLRGRLMICDRIAKSSMAFVKHLIERLNDQADLIERVVHIVIGPPACDLRKSKKANRQLGCLTEQAAHVRHKWVPATELQAELVQCAKSPTCNREVSRVCSHKLCGLGYCDKHRHVAPRISGSLGLSVRTGKKC
jgi:hypothetical protein